jgi:hypothetical protein
MTKLKRQLFATVSLAIITLSLGAFGQLGIEDSEGTAAPELEGSWRVMVTLVGPGGPMPPFLTFSTFGRGGTFLESTQPGQGPGHGVWRRTRGREFGLTFQKLVFDANGNPAGTLKVREVFRLCVSGGSYAGNGTAEVFDPSGTLVVSFCAKTQGTRIAVEPPSCP